MSFVFILFLTTLAFPQIKKSAKAPPIKIKNTTQLPELFNFRKAVEDYGIAKSNNGFDSTLAYQFQYILDSVLVANNIMGASVALSMPEKGIWLGVSGLSDPETGDSIRHDMLFDIGSNTKTFVATLILQLVEDGLITLEDQLHQWLPAFPNIDSTITIRQILNHTSGVSDFLNDNPAASERIFNFPSKYWSREYTLSYVLERNFPKGTSWSYSNTGYILAGMIIKEVTGSDKVTPILKNRILDPLNLNSTFLDIEEPLIGELAHGWLYYSNSNNYINFSKIPRTAFYSAAWTAGAMVSTAEDMVKWARSLYSGQVLSQASLDEMFSIVPFESLYLGYGLGTIKKCLLGELAWAHGGDTFSYGSQATYFPDRDVAIAVLVNQRNEPYKDFYNKITELLFKKVLNYYLYPHDKVYPNHAKLNVLYFKPNQDSVKLSVHVNNPENHTVLAFSKIANTDSTYQDSIALYDDGLHGDSLAGDMIFGGAFTPLPMEDDFILSLRTLDLDSNYHHILENANRLTSIGPVVFDGYTIISPDTIPNPGDVISFRINLKNNGINKSAKEISANISSSDSSVLIHKMLYTSTFGEIEPGKIATSDRPYLIEIKSNCNKEKEIHFDVSIGLDGYTFWNDTFSIQVKLETEVIADNAKKLPTEFTLHQNFPNPFNPSTTISYQIPINGHVELSIYNINGQKVATLVSQRQEAGFYQYEWNAINLAGGVYLYRLTTDEFVQIKKLILLK